MTADDSNGSVLPDLGGWISGPCASIGHLEAVPCQEGYVDLRDGRHADEVLHVAADEFAAFTSMIKGGAYDHLLPG